LVIYTDGFEYCSWIFFLKTINFLPMKTLKELCTPRASIFDRSRRDTVLDLTDLIEDNIDPEDFFAENYLTDGMKRLLKEAFRRFRGVSSQGIFVLTQAMGGGKTHNMIALGLLARNPHLRSQVMGNLYESSVLPAVRVVAFTGRESDTPLGLWGTIAEQLGKKEQFGQYYSPLSAPGQTAWVNLLKGEPLLILLDELPPYLENARAKEIGSSDLAQVTSTALANLLTAVAKEDLANVCIVISDLKATYEGGSEQIDKALENLKGEVGRAAITLEPVALNTDELYHILRKRLFEKLPEESEILEVARAYAKAVSDAKQMDITNASPDRFTTQLKESYPFHFAIRDLYARFRENPGFQQTRGLISNSNEEKPKYKKGITQVQKQELQRIVFNQLSYDEKLEYCDRPEQISGASVEAWQEINDYLGTKAENLPQLIQQLGERQFGRIPRVGDAFCGGGSIPFEAARIGCEAYGSDLNPVAALLTWAALNIVGGGEEVAKQVREAQQQVYDAVDKQITA
jgi:hypothetical protein